MAKKMVRGATLPYGLTQTELLEAWRLTDAFLARAPSLFELSSQDFYTILNQRNLSGLVGEIFKHSLHKVVPGLTPNPHPDGRPDLLDLRMKATAAYFKEECLDPSNNAPIRTFLAPFKYGGIELKATIGDVTGASDLGIGQSRARLVKNINYWAHHRHACDLLGLYYDFDEMSGGVPQVRAIFFASLTEAHWAAVSTGKPGRKKTSTTSLIKDGRDAVKRGILAYEDTGPYMAMLTRIGVPVDARNR
jgi:hypothetical protein